MSATSLAIAADGVHLSFDGTQQVLSDVTLHVRQGEFVSLVGPSGCGKTTLLNLAAGLVAHTGKGSLTVGGQAPRQGNPQVGYMLARDSLMPWKTALGIFGFCLFLGSAMQSGWALFAFFVLGAVISGLYYVLNRQLTFGFTDAAGEVAAITFKRSVIEGQEINEEQLHKIIGVIENLIKHRDDHAGEVDIGSGSQGGRMASPAPTSLRQVFNGPDEVTAKPVASAAVQRTAQTGACPKCGNSITPDDVFCGGCGHKLK